MKQVLQNLKTGELSVEEIPAPLARPGGVVVHNHYSLISSGTEGGTVKLGQMTVLGYCCAGEVIEVHGQAQRQPEAGA